MPQMHKTMMKNSMSNNEATALPELTRRIASPTPGRTPEGLPDSKCHGSRLSLIESKHIQGIINAILNTIAPANIIADI